MAHRAVLTLTLVFALSLVAEAGYAQSDKPPTPTPAPRRPAAATRVAPAPQPAQVLILEQKIQLGTESATLRVQRLKGFTNQPGYSVYFVDSHEKVTEETAESLVFDMESNGSNVAPGDLHISVMDSTGKTLQSLPRMMTSEHLLVVIPASVAKKPITASVTVRDLPPQPVTVDVRRLKRQDKYFTDLQAPGG
jgi:hypothetical protein